MTSELVARVSLRNSSTVEVALALSCVMKTLLFPSIAMPYGEPPPPGASDTLEVGVAALYSSTREVEVVTSQTLPLVSIASLRGWIALMLCPPIVDTLTCGIPVGLSSVRLAAVVPLRFSTQIFPPASAAIFWGSFSGVVTPCIGCPGSNRWAACQRQ